MVRHREVPEVRALRRHTGEGLQRPRDRHVRLQASLAHQRADPGQPQRGEGERGLDAVAFDWFRYDALGNNQSCSERPLAWRLGTFRLNNLTGASTGNGWRVRFHPGKDFVSYFRAGSCDVRRRLRLVLQLVAVPRRDKGWPERLGARSPGELAGLFQGRDRAAEYASPLLQALHHHRAALHAEEPK